MTSIDTPASRPGRARLWLVLAAGILLGSGAMALLLPSSGGAPGSAARATQYQCPMHPQVVQDHPGDCPICTMKLVPVAPGQGASHPPAEDPIAFYRNPMDPSIHSPVPAKDSMGMDYLPVHESELGGGPAPDGFATVKIDPERQQLIGLRTVEAAEGPVGGSLRTSGRVGVDETRVRKVNVKVDGFVERLFVDFTGKPVAKGQPLLALYSPELVSAQNEFLLALRTKKALAGSPVAGRSGEDLLSSARQRLRLWDIPDAAIDRLEATGEPQRTLTLVSPVSGVVTVKNVVQGARVGPADALFEITDLGQVWVLADLYERDLASARVGMGAAFTTDALPNRAFAGQVAFIDPVLDPRTRTAKVRVAIANPRGDLRPDLFGDVVLQARARTGLRIPEDAVIDTGTRKLVFVALAEGKFQPREVKLGAAREGQVEVVSGLEAGERVVTRAAFLVDSESRMKAAISALGGKP